MGRKGEDPILPKHVPTPEEVARFEQTGRPEYGPSLPNLRLDVATGKLASKWNKRAALLFCDYFHQQPGCASIEDEEIQRTFKTHLQTLNRHFIRAQQIPTPAAQQNKADKASKDNRATRLRNVGFLSYVSTFE